jgi:hypothetical protein
MSNPTTLEEWHEAGRLHAREWLVAGGQFLLDNISDSVSGEYSPAVAQAIWEGVFDEISDSEAGRGYWTNNSVR